MVLKKPLILASSSPRRKQLLKQIGLTFEVRDSGISEKDFSTNPEECVRHLSEAKARAVSSAVSDGIVIGADTIVVLDDRILGKPADADDAVRMLSALSGRTHLVYTGFTLVDKPSGRSVTAVEVTKVTFRILGTGEIHEYVRSGSPLDKAGAYGIQDDYGAVFVERVEGCFYNVVGLPLTRFYMTLLQFQDNPGVH